MSVQEMSLNKIKLAKNSRLHMNHEDLSELMASIKQVGLLQPIGVVKNGSGYEVCYGNRRFLAVSKLGIQKIPVIVHSSKRAHDSEIKNLTENIQRRNLTLAEAGRYIDLLQTEGLTSAEVAARLGVGTSYVKNCLDAYRKVPAEFRDDLEIRVTDKKKSAGKIAIKTAQAILSAEKTYRLEKPQVTALFKAAKTSDDFIEANVNKYAKAIKSGEKNFLQSVRPLKQINTVFFIEEREHDRLMAEYVTDGPFKSLSGLFQAILEGKKAVKVKMANRN